MNQTSEPTPGPGTDQTQRNPNAPVYFPSQPAPESDEMSPDTMYDDTDDMDEDEFDQEAVHQHDRPRPQYMPAPHWVTDGPMGRNALDRMNPRQGG